MIAFYLSNYQENRALKKEKESIRSQCIQEIDNFIFQMSPAPAIYDSIYHTFVTAEKNLERPEIPFRNISFNYNESIWNLAIDKNVFAPDLTISIGEFLSTVQILKKYSERQHEFNKLILLPDLDKGLSAFYDPSTKRLRKKHQWYSKNLNTIKFNYEKLIYHSKVLQEELKKS